MQSKFPFGATPINPDDQAGLIPAYITTREELNAAEFANINCAALKYFSRPSSKKKSVFTALWLKQLHRDMFGDVWQWAGQIRKNDIQPGIPVHQIAAEMKKFEDDFSAWGKFKHDPLEISAKIHHRLVWIHPFRNGNGRWARFAANIYLYEFDKKIIEWPENEFFIGGGFRKDYVAALQAADRGDITELTSLHKRFLKQSGI